MSVVKTPPKTIYQFRNLTYLVVSWLGFNKGFRQKRDNDALWTEYQTGKWKQRALEMQMAEDQKHQAARAASATKIPDAVPPELEGLYKSFTGTS